MAKIRISKRILRRRSKYGWATVGSTPPLMSQKTADRLLEKMIKEKAAMKKAKKVPGPAWQHRFIVVMREVNGWGTVYRRHTRKT